MEFIFAFFCKVEKNYIFVVEKFDLQVPIFRIT